MAGAGVAAAGEATTGSAEGSSHEAVAVSGVAFDVLASETGAGALAVTGSGELAQATRPMEMANEIEMLRIMLPPAHR